MELFRDDGCLTDEGLRALTAGQLDELGRLEAAEHLSYCDRCLQRYTELLTDEVLAPPPSPAGPGLRRRLRRRTVRLTVSRYATAAAAVVLTLTVLWGSIGLSGQAVPAEPTFLERAGTALTEWTAAWPLAWADALSGFSELFDDFGIPPRNDLTQGGTHP